MRLGDARPAGRGSAPASRSTWSATRTAPRSPSSYALAVLDGDGPAAARRTGADLAGDRHLARSRRSVASDRAVRRAGLRAARRGRSSTSSSIRTSTSRSASTRPARRSASPARLARRIDAAGAAGPAAGLSADARVRLDRGLDRASRGRGRRAARPPRPRRPRAGAVRRQSLRRSCSRCWSSDPGPLTQRLLAQPQRPYALTRDHQRDARTRCRSMELRVPAGAAQTTERRARPGLAARRVLAVARRAAVPARRSAVRLRSCAVRPNHVQLGSIEVRGENGVLNVPSWMLTRQRSNPFHAYLLERIDEFVLPATPRTGQPPAVPSTP